MALSTMQLKVGFFGFVPITHSKINSRLYARWHNMHRVCVQNPEGKTLLMSDLCFLKSMAPWLPNLVRRIADHVTGLLHMQGWDCLVLKGHKFPYCLMEKIM